MDRVVIFTQSNDRIANILLRGFLKALQNRTDMKLVAICLPYPHTNGRLIRRLLRDSVSQLFNLIRGRRGHNLPPLPLPVFIDQVASKLNFRMLVPPAGNINNAEFISELRNELQPTVAFSCICLSKFSPELLGSFDYAVNYHNALLPMYKGLRATAWSVYCREQETGFTFHRMTEALDEGFLLKQGSIPVHSCSRTIDLDLLKAEKAVLAIPELLQMVAKRDSGTPQVGDGNYFSKSDERRIRSLEDPTALNGEEILRRLHSFGSLEIMVDGRWINVTRLIQLFKKETVRVKSDFVTADGRRFRCSKFMSLDTFIAMIKRRNP